MLFELIAVIVAGFAAGGVGALARRTIRTLPGWIVPVAAGGAMLVVAISLEYSWYGRTAAGLPDQVEVASTHESRAIWRPWTYVVRYVDRFVAVDHRSARTHADVEGQKMVDVYLFGRWTPTVRVTSVFDCLQGRRADLRGGVELSGDGSVPEANWIATDPGDPVTQTACEAI